MRANRWLRAVEGSHRQHRAQLAVMFRAVRQMKKGQYFLEV